MKVHFIGIGGSVMHNLAIALHHKNYQVTGSDDAIYDPSHSRLEAAGLLPEAEGWQPQLIHKDLDAVIVGMHARRDNPELLVAQSLGVPTYSYPEWIYKQTEHKERIVIAGSHGKTTITAMIMHVLNRQQYLFDYLIGAYVEGFDTTVQLSDRSAVLLAEGDEYFSSPLDPVPKFLHYKHHIGVISGIAWDHANIYPNPQDYTAQFKLFAEQSVKAGALIYNAEDPAVLKIIEHNTKIREDVVLIPYRTHEHFVKDNKTYLRTSLGEIEIAVFGLHNMANLSAAKAVCARLGIVESQFYDAIRSFKGASQRLELIGESDSTCIFKDFAHAPSKLEATTEAVKKQYPMRKLTACIELHTFSSLDKNFIANYANTMRHADEAIVYYNPNLVKRKNLEPISEQEIKNAFNRQDLKVFTEIKNLEKMLLQSQWQDRNLLLMSSGNLAGLDLAQLSDRILKD
ncbi:MAG: peptidoglycan synthetase [Bernardetiaceae bacterium]|nr:peptidoglycan synthetase [Bernardetiaceae bacterium]